MVLREGYVRITTGDHLGKIAMHDAEAARKVRYLCGEQRLSCSLSDQLVDGGAVSSARLRFQRRIGQRDSRARACHVGQVMNSVRVAFADKQRESAILREVACLRLDYSELTHLSQWGGPGHHDIGVETRLATDVEREIAERDCAGAYHLHDDGLG